MTYLCLLPGILEVGKMIGPILGYLMGPFCANIYVDTGSVNTGNTMNFIYKVQSPECERILWNDKRMSLLIN
jgi:hypothetical protein